MPENGFARRDRLFCAVTLLTARKSLITGWKGYKMPIVRIVSDTTDRLEKIEYLPKTGEKITIHNVEFIVQKREANHESWQADVTLYVKETCPKSRL